VKNRFQILPFKCNLQRYLAVRYMWTGSGGGGAPTITVLGHGALVDVAGVAGGTGSDAYTEYTYVFVYGGAGAMSVRLGSKASGGSASAAQWALSKVEVKSHVDNYAPAVSDKSVTVSANPSDGSGTIELPSSDAECDAVTVQVTSLPTEGRLYLCSCSNVWTQPITAAMLPADVSAGGSACSRVVGRCTLTPP
jgi:hypothetical protein